MPSETNETLSEDLKDNSQNAAIQQQQQIKVKTLEQQPVDSYEIFLKELLNPENNALPTQSVWNVIGKSMSVSYLIVTEAKLSKMLHTKTDEKLKLGLIDWNCSPLSILH